MGSPQYHSFLSHNGDDKPAVEELAKQFKEEGIECWLDRWHLIPGEPFQPAIEEALEQSRTCCVFIGPSGVGPWQNEEMRVAIERRVKDGSYRVIPVLLPGGHREKRSRLPRFLVEHTWVEFHKSLDDPDAFHRLKCAILGEQPGVGPNDFITPDQCPYPGLQTFQIEDAPLFFGREAQIEWLLEKLSSDFNTPQETRFLGIVGASGSGKSSLARAGLLAGIQDGKLPDSSNWPLITFQPGYDPLKQLALAVWNHPDLKEAAGDYGDFMNRMANDADRLHLTIDAALHNRPDNHRAVLLVDQFEELFTLANFRNCIRQNSGSAESKEETNLNSDESGHAFINNLLEATRVHGGRTIVILTMRADFYGRCSFHSSLAEALSDQHELVGEMQANQLRKAIERPAERTGCELDPGLTEMLIEAMENQPGALPLLQHALRQLWIRRTGRKLTVEAYKDIGRLEGALDRHANELFDRLSDEQQETCRRIFLRLIQPSEGSEDTKRRASRSELGEAEPIDQVLDRLATARLITTSGKDETNGTQFVDISHEALIRGWQKLGDWISDNRESIRIRQRLTIAAGEWQQNNRDGDYLYRGARLQEAEEWSIARPGDLSSAEKVFLKASVNAREVERHKQRNVIRLYAFAALVGAILAGVATFFYNDAHTKEKQLESNNSELTAKNNELDKTNAELGESNDKLTKLNEELEQKEQDQKRLVKEARLQLAEHYFQSGISFRDGFGERLKASHYFTKAAAEFVDSDSSTENALIAANFLVKGTKLNQIFAHGFEGVKISREESRIWTWTTSGTVLWDTQRGEAVARLGVGGHFLTFNADESRILTWSRQHAARLWDVDQDELVAWFQHDAWVSGARFNADESRILTWSEDGTARLWDVVNNKVVAKFKHEDWVLGARFSANESRVLTWSRDGTARLWDVVSKKVVAQFQHEGEVLGAQFNRDESYILTSGGGGTHLWDAKAIPSRYLKDLRTKVRSSVKTRVVS